MDLFFREFGKENTEHLLILHGLYGCSDNWMVIARKLAENYHVIVPDLRNHGQSPHASEHSYQLMAYDIQTLLEKLGIHKLHVVGHSMGGKLAMSIAALHQDMVEKLIVLDISPRASNKSDNPPKNALFHMRLMNHLTQIDLKNLSNYSEADEQLKHYIAEDRLRGFILKNIKKSDDGLDWKFNLSSLKDNLPEIMAGIYPEHLRDSKIKIPSLFLRGAKSDYIKIEDFKLIRSTFPYSEIISIPDAGHWLHAEQPQLVLKNLLYFLKS